MLIRVLWEDVVRKQTWLGMWFVLVVAQLVMVVTAYTDWWSASTGVMLVILALSVVQLVAGVGLMVFMLRRPAG